MRLEDTRKCLNFLVRRASRTIGRYYDAALKPAGIRVTQFNVMAVLAQAGPLPIMRLAMLLGVERSALARNLKPLQRQGFVAFVAGADKRVRTAKLTPQGKKKLLGALGAWSKAQDALVAELGAPDVSRTIDILSRLAERPQRN